MSRKLAILASLLENLEFSAHFAFFDAAGVDYSDWHLEWGSENPIFGKISFFYIYCTKYGSKTRNTCKLRIETIRYSYSGLRTTTPIYIYT